jgi:heterodisulfide reductase subunit B
MTDAKKPRVYVASESCLFDDHESASVHDDCGPWGTFVDVSAYVQLQAKVDSLEQDNATLEADNARLRELLRECEYAFNLGQNDCFDSQECRREFRQMHEKVLTKLRELDQSKGEE